MKKVLTMHYIYYLTSCLAFIPGFAIADERPNFVMFLADDMTWTDVGCYGNSDVRTPNIDRLALQGIRFTKFYNSAPTCSPLRQSLYTGIYPIRNGAHPNHSRVYEGIESLPHHLRRLGYRVALVGKRHEAPAEAFPFDQLGGSHGDNGKTPAGADLPLENVIPWLDQKPDTPWCLVVASNQPHSAWNRGDASKYPLNKLTVPPYLVDTPELREGLSRYYAEIEYMDDQVGQVMAILEERGVVDNTLMLWLSEQGSQLPFCKWTCYDTGIHSAAVLRWPSRVVAGQTSDALISYVDVVPTFVDLAGGAPSKLDFDGHSFAKVLYGDSSRHNDVIYATNTTRGIYHGSEAFATRAATDGQWLYIRNLHPEETFQNMVTNRDPIFASWANVDTDFARSRIKAYSRRPAEELYNLTEDPWCLDNVAGQHESDLPTHLNAWMQQQGDEGNVTERAAESRQPEKKPWGKSGVYYRSRR